MLVKDQNFEMTSYSAKGKPEGRTKNRVLERVEADGTVTWRVSTEVFDKKDEKTAEIEYRLRCEDDVFYIDMENLLDAEFYDQYGSMEFTAQGDFLDFPKNLSPGQQLGDGELNVGVSTGGVTMMNMRMQVKNRQVEAAESITVPAGTFDCYRISYDVETKMLVNVKLRVVEWFSKGFGVIRSQTFSKNGKLKGYTELTKLDR